MELVDDDDPILMRCPLVIEGSLGETRDAEPAWPKHQPTGLGRAGSCPRASPLHGPRPRGGGLTSWILRKSPHGAPWRGQIRRFYVRKTLGGVSRGTGLFGAILAGDDIKGVVGSQRGQTLCFTRSYNHPARRSCWLGRAPGCRGTGRGGGHGVPHQAPLCRSWISWGAARPGPSEPGTGSWRTGAKPT